jgi:diaminohydroxyphosphoribosylaminopyrimidine deaminase/5-amino-6-(5-phosphoribosylamino)uracil reductase
VTTIDQAPVLVCVSQRSSQDTVQRLKNLGCQVLQTLGTEQVDLVEVLLELGRRQVTHAMLEIGPRLMGSFFDQQLVNEIHAFVAPKLLGGQMSLSPVGGDGLLQIPAIANLRRMRSRYVGEDILIEADCMTTPARNANI